MRLRNAVSGVTVSVDEETAALLGSDWADADRLSDNPEKSWKVADLKAYAEENGIDLLDATKKEDILAAIEIHGHASGDEGTGSGAGLSE